MSLAPRIPAVFSSNGGAACSRGNDPLGTPARRCVALLRGAIEEFADGFFWSVNPVPVPVSKRDVAFTTAYEYIFDRKMPDSEEARRALALYREARSAQQNEFVSYAVLNYYKIIEIRNHGKEAARKWFQTHFEALRTESKGDDDISRVLAPCGSEPPIVSLHTAASVMHRLARRFL